MDTAAQMRSCAPLGTRSQLGTPIEMGGAMETPIEQPLSASSIDGVADDDVGHAELNTNPEILRGQSARRFRLGYPSDASMPRIACCVSSVNQPLSIGSGASVVSRESAPARNARLVCVKV